MTELRLASVRVDRGGFPVVRGVDLVAPAGQVTVLLGPNGAGKTTLLEAISGVVGVTGGRIGLGGRDLTRAGRGDRARSGISHVEQGRRVFADLTVEENLDIVGSGRGLERGLALFPELHGRRTVLAGALSGGEQQMLVIARAFAGDPTMLLVDELSLGLAPVLVRRMIPVLREVADRGVGVLLVEQYADQALRIGDRAYLLNRGEITFTGQAAELLDHPDELRRAYLGLAPTPAPEPAHGRADPDEGSPTPGPPRQ